MARNSGKSGRIEQPTKNQKSRFPKEATFVGLFLLASVILLIKVTGDQLYAYEANPNIDKIGKSTLIVCLAGGKGRIQSALSLYSRGKGLALFIAGAGPKTTRETLLREHLPPEAIASISGSRRENIVVETQSRNTIENAYAIARFLRSNPEVTDIILITSAYHMRRSLLIVENALRGQVTVIPYTAKEGAAILRENWTSSWVGIGVTLEETGKLLLARIFIPMLEIF
jgi:uncharacterized SAM-binding protein YcdF (DUF218 family)